MEKQTVLIKKTVDDFHREGDLNTKRIKAYKDIAKEYNAPVSVIRDVFSLGINFAIANLEEVEATVDSENKRTTEEQLQSSGVVNPKWVKTCSGIVEDHTMPISTVIGVHTHAIKTAIENKQGTGIGSGNKPDAEEQNNKAQRHNTDKLRWSLVDFDALEPMVRVLEFGARKYSDHNWKKGLKTTEICESLLRHLTAYLGGEDIDPESGLPHTGHILCNAMFLSYMEQYRPDCDDRYRGEGKNGEVIINWEVTKK